MYWDTNVPEVVINGNKWSQLVTNNLLTLMVPVIIVNEAGRKFIKHISSTRKLLLMLGTERR